MGSPVGGALAGWDWAELIIPVACLAVLWQSPVSGLVVLLMAVVSIALERAAPFRPQRHLRTGWRTDVYHALLTRTVAAAAAAGVAIAVTGAAGSVLTPFLGAVRGQSAPLLIIEALILADMGAYFEHRACHKVGFLWRFHRIHHIGEDLDWLSRYRIHPLDAAALGVVELLPFYLLGVPAWATATYLIVVTFNGTWAHSNVNHTIGPLWWIIKNPEFHRWHHAKEKIAANRNFCELFPIWDVIFRTSYLPRDRKPTALGIPGNEPIGYVDQLMAPLVPEKRRRAA